MTFGFVDRRSIQLSYGRVPGLGRPRAEDRSDGGPHGTASRAARSRSFNPPWPRSNTLAAVSRRPPRALAAALLAGVALVAGCDPSNSEDDRVRDAIGSTLAGLASGDADVFCPTLADAAAEQTFVEDFGGPCDQERVEEILGDHTPEQRERLLDPQIAVIKIKDETAGSTVNGEYMQMREVDGEWRLSTYEIPPTRESIRATAGL